MNVNLINVIWRGSPVKRLTIPLNRRGGRNNSGRITSFHRGGGSKRRYRILDLHRLFSNIPAVVRRVEYDPIRNSLLALLSYANGVLTYVPLVRDLVVGDIIVNYDPGYLNPGNTLRLAQIPVGFYINSIEDAPGSGSCLNRSSGSRAQLLARVGPVALVKLASGQVRKFSCDCKATLGTLAVLPRDSFSKLKAGRTRWLGFRPVVRGVAMNPIDHPHGGGEGKSSGGRKSSMTPWARYTKGFKTVKKKLSRKFDLTSSSFEFGDVTK